MPISSHQTPLFDAHGKNPSPAFVPPHFVKLNAISVLGTDDVSDKVNLLKVMVINSGFSKVFTASSDQEAVKFLRQLAHDKGNNIDDKLRQMTLLIVDDVPDNVDLVKAMLIRSGFSKILTAGSSQEALECLEQYVNDKSSAIDAILLDIMMPGMDGWELCRRIRRHEEWADIPVIMITANATLPEKVVRESFECGATDIMFKPIRRVELIPRVISALSLKKRPGSVT